MPKLRKLLRFLAPPKPSPTAPRHPDEASPLATIHEATPPAPSIHESINLPAISASPIYEESLHDSVAQVFGWRPPTPSNTSLPVAICPPVRRATNRSSSAPPTPTQPANETDVISEAHTSRGTFKSILSGNSVDGSTFRRRRRRSRHASLSIAQFDPPPEHDDIVIEHSKIYHQAIMETFTANDISDAAECSNQTNQTKVNESMESDWGIGWVLDKYQKEPEDIWDATAKETIMWQEGQEVEETEDGDHIVSKKMAAASVEKLVEWMSLHIDLGLERDFFMTFPLFVETSRLLRLLSSRFWWAWDKKEGNLVRVRLYALVRHWLLDFFSRDFLANVQLRKEFLDFITRAQWHPLVGKSVRDQRIVKELKNLYYRLWVYYRPNDKSHEFYARVNHGNIRSSVDVHAKKASFDVNARPHTSHGHHYHFVKENKLLPKFSWEKINKVLESSVRNSAVLDETEKRGPPDGTSPRVRQRVGVASVYEQQKVSYLDDVETEGSEYEEGPSRKIKRRPEKLYNRILGEIALVKRSLNQKGSYIRGLRRNSNQSDRCITCDHDTTNNIDKVIVQLHNNSQPNVLRPDTGYGSECKKCTCFIEHYRTEQIVQAFWMVERAFLLRIKPQELLTTSWDNSTHVRKLIDRFNTVYQWVISEVVSVEKPAKRTRLIEKFIRISQKSYSMGNYATLTQIILALQSPAIARLESSWDNVGNYEMHVMEMLEAIITPVKNWKQLRDSMERRGTIPFLGPYLADVTFSAELPAYLAPNMMNISKFRTLARTVRKVLHFQFLVEQVRWNADKTLLQRCRDLSVLDNKTVMLKSHQIEPNLL